VSHVTKPSKALAVSNPAHAAPPRLGLHYRARPTEDASGEDSENQSTGHPSPNHHRGEPGVRTKYPHLGSATPTEYLVISALFLPRSVRNQDPTLPKSRLRRRCGTLRNRSVVDSQRACSERFRTVIAIPALSSAFPLRDLLSRLRRIPSAMARSTVPVYIASTQFWATSVMELSGTQR
jgi:hypothetical protein